MKKQMIVVGLAALSIAAYGQWGMMQSQITPQQIDALFASLPPERVQAGIVGYWQDVVNAARSGNVSQQQCVLSLAPIIRKYDPQYQEHLLSAVQVAVFMSPCVQPNGLQPNVAMPMPNTVPMPTPMPMPAFGGGGVERQCTYERKCTIHNITYDMRFGRCPACRTPQYR